MFRWWPPKLKEFDIANDKAKDLFDAPLEDVGILEKSFSLKRMF